MTVTEVEPTMTKAEAQRLTDDIRTAVVNTWGMVQRAYLDGAWSALGYDSWDAYCDAEFPRKLQLPREERTAVVAALRAAGMSTRAIASATGVARNTIMSDLQLAQIEPPDDRYVLRPARDLPPDATYMMPDGPHRYDERPSLIVGRDGKRYAARTSPDLPTRLSPDASAICVEFIRALRRMVATRPEVPFDSLTRDEAQARAIELRAVRDEIDLLIELLEVALP